MFANGKMYEPFLNGLYKVLYAFIFERWKNIFRISLYISCIYKTCMYICREH